MDAMESPRLLLTTDRFRVVEYVQHPVGNGPFKRAVVVHPGAVVILPLLEGNRICLIQNFRIAVGKTLLELPAGTIDADEDPWETAQRELHEETGYSASHWHELPGFYMSPGILNERMHVFVAKNLVPGDAQREPWEEIENVIVTWEEAVAMAHSGTIEDAKSLVAILRWDRMRDEQG